MGKSVADLMAETWPHLRHLHEPSPEVGARIRKLMASRDGRMPRAERKAVNQEIYRLYSSEHIYHEKPAKCLPDGATRASVALDAAQAGFVAALGAGLMSRGLRACVDMAMSAKTLPELPKELK